MSEAWRSEAPQGLRRVAEQLALAQHPHAPVWLDVAARTSQEAADALGVQVGQIAKSVMFRRRSDDAAVLIVTSGDRRVAIGGVAPLAHLTAPLTLLDRELFRFEGVWSAAGHPNPVFLASPEQLIALTGAPVADVTQD